MIFVQLFLRIDLATIKQKHFICNDPNRLSYMQQSKKCLVIDDDQDDQEIFVMCVEAIDQNISCLSMEDATQAISWLGTHVADKPDFIFVDVNMPKINGLECLREIRRMEHLNTTRVFMYSTSSEDTTIQKSRELGAEDFIVKPSRLAELREKLRHIFTGQLQT
jgi:CheY-like chemotaxis protein